MFIKKTPVMKTGLEEARDVVLFEMRGFEAHDDDYQKLVEHVKTLTQLIDLEKPKRERLSPNTLALVLGNAIVALIVVGYESKNVMTSKYQGFMLKFK